MKGLSHPSRRFLLPPGHEQEVARLHPQPQAAELNPTYHAKIDAAIHLANLSLKLGRAIRFDPAAPERIVGDDETARWPSRSTAILEVSRPLPVIMGRWGSTVGCRNPFPAAISW